MEQKTRPRRRWTRRLAWAAAIGVVVVALALLFRGPLATFAVERLAARAGVEITVEELEIDSISPLSIHAARVRARAARWSVDATGVELSARAGDLAADPLRAIDRIRIGALVVEVDAAPRSTAASASSSTIEIPERLPAILVGSADVRVKRGPRSFVALTGARVTVEPSDGGAAPSASIAIAADELRFEDENGARAHPLDFAARWSQRTLSIARARFDPRFEVDSAEIDLARLADGVLRGRVRGRAFDGGLAVEAALDPAATELDVDAEAVDLAALLALFGVDVLERGTVTGRAAVRLPRRGEPWTLDARVDVTDARVAGADVDFARGHFVLDETSIALDDALFLRGANALRVQVARTPRDEPIACAWRDSMIVELDASLRDVGALAAIADAPRGLEALTGGTFEASATLVRGRFEHLRGRAQLGPDAVVIRAGSVPVDAGPRAAMFDQSLDLVLGLELPDLARAAEVARAFDLELPRVAGELSGTLVLRGGARGLVGDLDARARNVAVGDLIATRALARLSLDADEARVESIEADTDAGTLRARGGWRFADRALVDARLSLDVADLARASGVAGWSGRFSIEARARGPLDALDATVEARGHDVEIDGLALADARLSATSVAGEWRIEELSAAIDRVRVALAGAARFSGERLDAVLERFDLDTAHAVFALGAPARASLDRRALELDAVVLAGSSGSASVDLSAGPHGLCVGADLDLVDAGALAADLWTSRPELSVWRTLRARIDVSRSTEALFASAVGDARLEWRETPATLVFEAALEPGRLRVRNVQLEAGAFGRASARADVPFGATHDGRPFESPVDVAVEAQLPDLGAVASSFAIQGVAGSISAQVAIAGPATKPAGTFDVEAVGLAWSSMPGRLEGDEPAAIELRGEIGDRIDVARLAAVLPGVLSLEGRARIDAPLDLDALARGDRSRLLDAPLSGEIHGGVDDLSPIGARIPSVRRLGGRLRIDARVEGSAGAPRPSGSLVIEDGEVRVLGELPTVRAVFARVELEPDRLKLVEISGELGAAPVRARGEIGLRGASPSLDVAIEGDGVLLYRADRIVVRADAKLTLTGTFAEPALGGDIDLVRSRFAQRFDWLSLAKPRGRGSSPARGLRLPSIDTPPLDRLALDLRIGAKDPFVIENNMARGKITPRLWITGTAKEPIPRGTIDVLPTRVALPAGPIEIQGGRIDFRPERPAYPDIDLQATTRLQGYDVTMHISGRYDAARVDLSSTPPLPREDLALLVLTGRPPRKTSSIDLERENTTGIAVFLATDVFSKVFVESDAGGDSLTERIEVVTGTDPTNRGQDTILARFRLADELVSKRDSLYLTAERDAWDADNFGVRWVFRFR